MLYDNEWLYFFFLEDVYNLYNFFFTLSGFFLLQIDYF